METLMELMREALQPFAIEADAWDEFDSMENIVEGWKDGTDSRINVGNLRKARRIYNMVKPATNQ